MYILKPFKRVSVDFYCDWIRGVIKYSSDAICNAFVCQFSVCTSNVDIPMTFVPYACAPELCIMLTFFRYSGRFLLTY